MKENKHILKIKSIEGVGLEGNMVRIKAIVDYYWIIDGKESSKLKELNFKKIHKDKSLEFYFFYKKNVDNSYELRSFYDQISGAGGFYKIGYLGFLETMPVPYPFNGLVVISLLILNIFILIPIDLFFRIYKKRPLVSYNSHLIPDRLIKALLFGIGWLIAVLLIIHSIRLAANA